MRFIWLLITIIFLVTTQDCLGQKKQAVKSYLKGISLAIRGVENTSRAEKYFLKAIRISPEYYDAHMSLGDLYSQQGKPEKAIISFSKAAKGSPREGFFKIGNLALKNGLYETSNEAFLKYLLILNLPKTKKKTVLKLLENAKFGMSAVLIPQTITPKLIRDNNDTNSYPESYFFPSISGDDSTLYFTGRNFLNAPLDENIYIVNKIDSISWSTPNRVSGNINTRLNEGAVSVQGDQKKMSLAACGREDGYGSCDIYLSFNSKRGWSDAQNIGSAINTSQWETQPCLSADGQFLFFVRDAKKRGSNSNIWMSRWNGKYWSLAKQLPSEINGSGDEFSPFLHADGKSLYFASNSHVGMGGLDLFRSTWKDDGSWTKPINLGYPINDHTDNFGLVVSPDGSTGYLAGGVLNNSFDSSSQSKNPQIYQFKIPLSIMPRATTWVEIWAISSLNGEVVKNASWSIGQNGLGMEAVGEGGSFQTAISLGSELAFNVVANGYNMVSKRIVTEMRNTSLKKDTVFMIPIHNGDHFTLNNILFELNRAQLMSHSGLEISRIVKWMQKNPSLHIELQGHTDDTGTKERNIELSRKRAEAVYLELINKGILESRLSFRGFGDRLPVSSNYSKEGRTLNRRTEVSITKI
ncbi:MAG: Outer membrane porin F [Owenweeksia sp. TMED14]|nr:MAG: Outer membrane porin F [Owenweeksia sp. TMED14]|tara:strand:- start:204 stop:2114 length:1911 start_codon:yes stop_codon:yes gene_type:complete